MPGLFRRILLPPFQAGWNLQMEEPPEVQPVAQAK